MIKPHTPKPEEKIWGKATGYFHDGAYTEAHLAEINPGGFCSVHKHEYKHNHFFILSGRVLIEIYNNLDAEASAAVVQVIALEQGMAATVPAGIYHRFFTRMPSIVLETYTPLEGHKVELNDIVRVKPGGVACVVPYYGSVTTEINPGSSSEKVHQSPDL